MEKLGMAKEFIDMVNFSFTWGRIFHLLQWQNNVIFPHQERNKAWLPSCPIFIFSNGRSCEYHDQTNYGYGVINGTVMLEEGQEE